MKNKVSIVFTARDDNYGGNLIDRINASVRTLINATNLLRSEIELIIVDYNPPKQRLLSDILKIKNNRYLRVRFIVLPPKIHEGFPNNTRIKLFEYTAKNIGIRRATGDYIISTNQDILFGFEFVKFLVQGNLKKTKFYRTNRIDVNISPDILKLPAQKLLERCKKDAYVKKTIKGDVFLSLFSIHALSARLKNRIYLSYIFFHGLLNPKFAKAKILPHGYHTFAAGDFFMLHKSGWAKIRGFDETKEGNDYLDGYALIMAGCVGMKQEIIEEAMYHVDHLMSKAGRPSVNFLQFVKNCNYMIRTGRPYKTNSKDWGLAERRLKEVVTPFAR